MRLVRIAGLAAATLLVALAACGQRSQQPSEGGPGLDTAQRPATGVTIDGPALNP